MNLEKLDRVYIESDDTFATVVEINGATVVVLPDSDDLTMTVPLENVQKLKTFKVDATMTSHLTANVEAVDEEHARKIGQRLSEFGMMAESSVDFQMGEANEVLEFPLDSNRKPLTMA